MGVGSIGPGAQAVRIHVAAAGQGRRQPEQHRHMGLLRGRDRIGNAVQIESLLTQRLAVVGDVEQGTIDVGRRAMERVDQAGEHVVGVEDGIVIGVDDLLARAVAQLRGPAVGREAPELRWIALEVSRAVIAHHVQGDHGVAADRLELALQALDQHAVVALAAGTEVGRGAHIGPGYLDPAAGADALASRLVVDPFHGIAGVRQHVEQAFRVADAALVVVFATEHREHAGQRDFGRGAAGADLAESDDVAHNQLRVGLARIAEQREIGSTGGFADHQHEHARPGCRRHALHRGVPSQSLARRVRVGHAPQRIQAEAIEHVPRSDQIARLVLVAHQRRQVARDGQQREHGDEQCAEHGAGTPQQRPRQALPREAHPPDEGDGQRRRGRDPGEHAPVQQVARLAHIGTQHVLDHGRIEDHREGSHVVGRGRGDDHDQGQQRPDDPAMGQGREQREMQRDQGDEARGGETPAAGIRPGTAGHDRLPPWAVRGHDHEDDDQQHQGFGPQRRTDAGAHGGAEAPKA